LLKTTICPRIAQNPRAETFLFSLSPLLSVEAEESSRGEGIGGGGKKEKMSGGGSERERREVDREKTP
jgi:hypothetical protein